MGQWKHVFDFRVSCGLKVDVIVSFSCIAVTVTAQLYQRSRLLLETHWKEEHCDISRYVLIMSLSPCACTGFFCRLPELSVCEQQSYRSPLAEQPTRTSLDLELDLQACRTRQRQLMEELSALRELKLRLEEPQTREATELPNWALRDERFRCLLREAQRQVRKPSGLQLPYKYASPSSV